MLVSGSDFYIFFTPVTTMIQTDWGRQGPLGVSVNPQSLVSARNCTVSKTATGQGQARQLLHGFSQEKFARPATATSQPAFIIGVIDVHNPTQAVRIPTKALQAGAMSTGRGAIGSTGAASFDELSPAEATLVSANALTTLQVYR